MDAYREHIAGWLRDVAVWSPSVHWAPLDERVAVFTEVLAINRFAWAVYCDATVKLIAFKYDTFPSYCEMRATLAPIDEALAQWRASQ